MFLSIKYVTFLLLPIYALLFKLLYIRKKSFYVDHLVYMMHVQSFVYCVLSFLFLLLLIVPLSLEIVKYVSLVVIFVYVSASLRYLYHQPWWKTITKAIIATFLLYVITVITLFIIALGDAMFIQ